MVTLTRMTGVQFALNPDLIERVDNTPDTVITLVDGTKYLVMESIDEVQRRVLEYRAAIIHVAHAFEREVAEHSDRGDHRESREGTVTRLSSVPAPTNDGTL